MTIFQYLFTITYVKPKKRFLRLLLPFLLLSVSSNMMAQSDTLNVVTVCANVDLMSRYLWRGQDYGQAPSIQPGLSATWKDFTLGAWGAYKFTGSGNQETDLYLSKTIGPITLVVWDYWSYCDTTSMDYFDYKQKTTSHQFEAQVLLSGNEKLPFNLLGSYFFYGSDTTNSIYFELQYLHSIGSTDLVLFAGFQPKGKYYAEKAAFVNVGCTIQKELAITDRWSLPLSLSFVINPALKSANLVAGVSF
jgi:hypothetical protein